MSMYIGGDKIDALYVKKTLSPGDTISYNDLTDKPFIPTAVADLSDASNYALKTDIQTYTAGTGIDITNGVISNTQTSAEWGNITGVLSTQSDLQSALDSKIDGSSLATVATSGDYNDLTNKPTIPEGLPSQSGNSGKFLTTDGSDASWATVDALPSQTGNSGKFLTTNGSAASWETVPLPEIDTELSSTSTNSVQNRVINSALKDKVDKNKYVIVIGSGAENGISNYGVLIGAESDNYGLSNTVIGGLSAKAGTSSNNVNHAIAIGSSACVYNNYAIQLGQGTNSEANSFYVGLSNSNNYKLLGSDGKIPDDRLNTTIARTSDYYTKAEVDAMIGNIESILQRLNSGNNS